MVLLNPLRRLLQFILPAKDVLPLSFRVRFWLAVERDEGGLGDELTEAAWGAEEFVSLVTSFS